MNDFRTLSLGSVTGWRYWCSGQRWCQIGSQLWSRLWRWPSASVGRRCTCSFQSPVCLRILFSATVARKVFSCVVLTKHSRVSCYCSCDHFNLRRRNTPLSFFSDLGLKFLNQISRFLYYRVRTPFFGHFRHIQGQAHVGLFQLYTTSLPCHLSRQVEYLQEVRCCFKQWDVAVTSTIITSVAFSKVIKACVVHWWGCLLGNSCVKIPELRTLWCLISQTGPTNATVDKSGFLLPVPIHWLWSSQHTPAVCYTVYWRPFTTAWI